MIALFLLLITPADDIVPRATLDRTKISLAENVTLTLSLESNQSFDVTLPDRLLTAESAAQWRVVSRSTPERSPQSPFRWVWTIRLTADEPGNRPIQCIPLEARIGSRVHTVNFPACDITVPDDVDPDQPNAVRELTGIEIIPDGESSTTGTWLIALIVAAVVGVCFWRWRAVRHRPAVNPLDRARQQLANAESSREDAETADRVSTMIRELLLAHFQFPAPLRTTAECLAALSGREDPVLQKAAQLLLHCDRYRFRPGPPSTAEGPALLRAAREWLDRIANPPIPSSP